MRFKDFYFDEAVIKHVMDREIIAKPKIVTTNIIVKGNRLFTYANADNSYFTFVFSRGDALPDKMYIGSSENVLKDPVYDGTKDELTMNQIHNVFRKVYKKQEHDASPAEVNRYRGEVRIHPPVQGYEEFPQDRNAEFFTDFENPNSVYQAGTTIAKKLIPVKKNEL